MKKKLLSTALIVSLMLSVAGCGETGNTSTVDGGTTIADNNEIAKKTEIAEENADVTEETKTTEKETIAEEIKAGSNKLVPDCPVTHPDADFSSLSLVFASGEEFKIDVTKGDTFGDFLEAFPNKNVRYSRMGNLENEVDFFFHGANFEGVFFEFVKDGEVWVKDYGVEYTKDSFVDYTINGVAIYSKEGEKKQESYRVCEGVGVGYKREEIESVLGEGHVGTNQELPTVMYNDGNVTMVIEYFPFEPKYKFEDTPDIIERVQTIYLIRNN